eukprot:731444-Pelagomonas_calceolata.AAC.4
MSSYINAVHVFAWATSCHCTGKEGLQFPAKLGHTIPAGPYCKQSGLHQRVPLLALTAAILLHPPLPFPLLHAPIMGEVCEHKHPHCM